MSKTKRILGTIFVFLFSSGYFFFVLQKLPENLNLPNKIGFGTVGVFGVLLFSGVTWFVTGFNRDKLRKQE